MAGYIYRKLILRIASNSPSALHHANLMGGRTHLLERMKATMVEDAIISLSSEAFAPLFKRTCK